MVGGRSGKLLRRGGSGGRHGWLMRCCAVSLLECDCCAVHPSLTGRGDEDCDDSIAQCAVALTEAAMQQ